MNTAFKLSAEEKKMEKMGKGAGFLIVGLILFFGAGSFLFHFWPRLEFLIREGEQPQVHSIDLAQQANQIASIQPGMVQVSGYPGPYLYEDYQASLTDNFRSARFIYLPLFKQPPALPITEPASAMIFLKEAKPGFFGFSAETASFYPKLGDLPPTEKVTYQGIVGYTDGGDLTDEFNNIANQYGIKLTSNALIVQEDTAHTWKGSGTLLILMTILTLISLYCLFRAYQLLRHSIL